MPGFLGSGIIQITSLYILWHTVRLFPVHEASGVSATEKAVEEEMEISRMGEKDRCLKLAQTLCSRTYFIKYLKTDIQLQT